MKGLIGCKRFLSVGYCCWPLVESKVRGQGTAAADTAQTALAKTAERRPRRPRLRALPGNIADSEVRRVVKF